MTKKKKKRVPIGYVEGRTVVIIGADLSQDDVNAMTRYGAVHAVWHQTGKPLEELLDDEDVESLYSACQRLGLLRVNMDMMKQLQLAGFVRDSHDAAARMRAFAKEIKDCEQRRRTAVAEASRADRRTQRQAPAPAEHVDALCSTCKKRPRHFDDLCKRCANDLGVRPTGRI